MKHIAFYAAILVLLVLAQSHVSMAVTCAPTQLAPCASAISSSSPPSTLCCTKLQQQKPCLCKYIKNPSLRNYVTSPNAKKVARICRVAVPKC
ncbi:putative bifunctional inhibitor/plant lipid transfer protein/seed storage helical [Helianthus anomalus]